MVTRSTSVLLPTAARSMRLRWTICVSWLCWVSSFTFVCHGYNRAQFVFSTTRDNFSSSLMSPSSMRSMRLNRFCLSRSDTRLLTHTIVFRRYVVLHFYLGVILRRWVCVKICESCLLCRASSRSRVLLHLGSCSYIDCNILLTSFSSFLK